MAGMSPRMKAKKGRFGPAGLLPPSITILTPVDGFTATATGSPLASDPIVFSGKAFDDLLGDVSATIIWDSSINGALGVGASVTSSLAVGVHTITAIVNAGGDTATDTITVTVV